MSVPESGYQQFGPHTDGAGEACEKVLLRARDVDVAEDNQAWFEVATPDVAAVALVRVSIRCPSGAGVNPNFDPATGAGAPYRWPARLFMTSSLRDRGPTTPTPSRAFAGSSASPLFIPTSADLWGYEQEIETAGGPLFGCLIVGADLSTLATPLGASDFSGAKSKPPVGFDWIVSVRYNARVPMDAAAWREVCAAAGVRVIKGGGYLK